VKDSNYNGVTYEYEQCMGQTGLTGAMWCDLFIFDSHCERIQYDSAVFARMLAKLDAYYLSDIS